MTLKQKIVFFVLAALAAALILGVVFTDAPDVYQGFSDRFLLLAYRPISLGLVLAVLIADAVLLGITLYAAVQFYKLKSLPPPQEAVSPRALEPRENIRREWEQIRALANSSTPSEWNMAVLRADALLEQALRNAGYEGQTFADRLAIADPMVLKSLDQLWSAHRTRNLIAHEPLEQHSRDTIIIALRAYEQTLKELGMLEEPTAASAPPTEQKKPAS